MIVRDASKGEEEICNKKQQEHVVKTHGDNEGGECGECSTIGFWCKMFKGGELNRGDHEAGKDEDKKHEQNESQWFKYEAGCI